MVSLRIRSYNVLFGDAILISFPERNFEGIEQIRHILIDVGNLLIKGGSDKVFGPIFENILEEISGNPLDLYVMTHEHLDHVQGLLWTNDEFYKNMGESLSEKLKTRYTWMTGSSATDYYDKHPDAKKKKLEFDRAYMEIEGYLEAVKGTKSISMAIEALRANNGRSTAKCIAYIRNLSKPENTFYVHREFDPEGHQPFTEVKIEIWAPEENTADYYSKLNLAPMALGVTKSTKGSKGKKSVLSDIIPPVGVYAGAFYELLRTRRRFYENLLAIDKAANNTSVVFCLEWRGFRLLFTGDAEEHSWKIIKEKIIDKEGFKPVHFLKISHHGSINGTPEKDILDRVLPEVKTDNKPRKALLSTYPEIGNREEEVYNNVPDADTVDLIRNRVDEFYEVDKVEPGRFVDVIFEVEN